MNRRLDELPGLPLRGAKSSTPKINEVFQLPAWPPLQLSQLLSAPGLQTLDRESPIPVWGKRQGPHGWAGEDTPGLPAARRERQGCGERAGHSYFLWDAGGERRYAWEEKSSKMVPMTEHGVICFCPSCVAMTPVLRCQRLLPTRPLVGTGGLPAAWLSGGLYTCFSSL